MLVFCEKKHANINHHLDLDDIDQYHEPSPLALITNRKAGNYLLVKVL